jgi:hypothetical protein
LSPSYDGEVFVGTLGILFKKLKMRPKAACGKSKRKFFLRIGRNYLFKEVDKSQRFAPEQTKTGSGSPKWESLGGVV